MTIVIFRNVEIYLGAFAFMNRLEVEFFQADAMFGPEWGCILKVPTAKNERGEAKFTGRFFGFWVNANPN